MNIQGAMIIFFNEKCLIRRISLKALFVKSDYACIEIEIHEKTDVN